MTASLENIAQAPTAAAAAVFSVISVGCMIGGVIEAWGEQICNDTGSSKLPLESISVSKTWGSNLGVEVLLVLTFICVLCMAVLACCIRNGQGSSCWIHVGITGTCTVSFGTACLLIFALTQVPTTSSCHFRFATGFILMIISLVCAVFTVIFGLMTQKIVRENCIPKPEIVTPEETFIIV
mmetsp:Transcript_21224/g.34526  ORF Transcript_21224/g.34526 Transcript_21224/m.34526 type:complete len:181 (+) Transcript_21224:41-583(+)